MNTTAVRANRQKLAILAALVLLCAAGYMLVGVHFDNAKLFQYAMRVVVGTAAIGGYAAAVGPAETLRFYPGLQVLEPVRFNKGHALPLPSCSSAAHTPPCQ